MSDYDKEYYRTHKNQRQISSKKWRVKNENHPIMARYSEGCERTESFRYQVYADELEELSHIQ